MNTSWPREAFFREFDKLLKASPFPHDSALAEASGISHSTLSSWRGGRQKPGTKALAAIARVLGVTSLELWELAGLVEPGTTIKALGVPSTSAVGTPTITKTAPPIPDEIVRLTRLFGQLNAEAQDAIRMQLRMAIAWAEGELSRSQAESTA